MVFITIGLHILNAAVMELFPMWVVYLILFSLIRISIVSQYSYSSRPWCKKRHTRYYCIHRPQTTQHWGPNGFPVWGGVVCNRNCYRVTGSNLSFHVSKHCSRVKSSGEKKMVNLFVTWWGHVWPWNESTSWTLLCPFIQWTMCRVAVETEENPARQMPAWRRSMLQFAAQSFTYTDNLNNSWSR